MKFAIASWLIISLLLSSVTVTASAANADRIGRKIDDFTLKDHRGKAYSLSDYANDAFIVVAFLGTECPLAKLYAPRLTALDEQYRTQGVRFLGINANSQDAVTEIAAYVRIHEVSFPILKDLGNRVADRFGAERTPEVFVLDKSRIVRYRGRIDDQYGIGVIRDEPKRNDLQIALDELLANRAVSEPETEPVGCHIGRVKVPEPGSPVTYSNQIARILQDRCVECHRPGEIAPFSLLQYDEVAGWSEMIAEVVNQNRMPPWHASSKYGHFKNDRHLSDQEKHLIRQWVKAGAPEGDPQQLPDQRQFVTGWQLPREPDRVIDISPRPVRIPAEGAIEYQYFQVDPKFDEDQWIQAAELLPGNRAVVHHILAFALPPGVTVRDFGGGTRGYLLGYVPGLRVEPYPEGMAKRIPAGSKLVFQMHYTPVGSVQHDLSKLALIFADPKTVKHEVKTTSAFQPKLRIPPGENAHRVTATSERLSSSALLLAMMPHMHLRGKAFRYEAQYPKGTEEILLDVPQYDFNWQTAYGLAEPKSLPAGTRMRCVAQFDNSEDNLSNPDPQRWVRWGEQTWDEMMIGYFDIAVPVEH